MSAMIGTPNFGGIPLLYHGTTYRAAHSILKDGFRLSDGGGSYTGKAVNLSQVFSVAWEYGPDNGGVVLEVSISNEASWLDVSTIDSPDYDTFFGETGVDALRTFWGNVWLLNSPQRVLSVRPLAYTDALRMLFAEFEKNGPDVGYNGAAGDLAVLYWDGVTAATTARRYFPGELAKFRRLFDEAGIDWRLDPRSPTS